MQCPLGSIVRDLGANGRHPLWVALATGSQHAAMPLVRATTFTDSADQSAHDATASSTNGKTCPSCHFAHDILGVVASTSPQFLSLSSAYL